MTDSGFTLRKADWLVQDLPFHATAVRFLEEHHYAKGAPNTSTYRHGLYRNAILVGDLMGVALWIPPTRGAAETVNPDWKKVLCLSRFCIHPNAPKNAASFLLGRSMALIDRRAWPTFLTYADTVKGHTGAIYKATNWTCLGAVPAADVWVNGDGVQRGRKRGGLTLTRAEMKALGFTLLPQLPKIKYVHHIHRGRTAA